jgi:hypothetical protein
VHQVVIAPVGEHSEKPDEVYRRIERLFPGPYLELFARKPRAHWTTWGDEIPRDAMVPPAAAPPPRLLNVKDAGRQSTPDRVYVGRPSKWGNPFHIGRDGTREQVIARYREWIVRQTALMAGLGELRGKDLACHCAPLPCHADTLLELANAPAAAPPPREEVAE